MKDQVTGANLENFREVLISSANKYKDKIAFQEKKNKQLISYTFTQLKNDVFELGAKLIEMGLKDKHIAIVGDNSYSWIVAYLAIITGVGVAVPLDKELDEELIAKLLVKSDCEAIFFSKGFKSKISNIVENSNVSTAISLVDSDNYNSIDDLIKEGKKLLNHGNKAYEDSKIILDDLNVIMFTSGTTGFNKGVMISHTNIMANVEMSAQCYCNAKKLIAVLPFHHIYQNVCGTLAPIALGATVFINDSLKYLTKNFKNFKPDMEVMVPLFLETMEKSIKVEITRGNFQKSFDRGVKISQFLLKFNIDVRRKFFKKILDNFGGNLNTIVCGGAALKPELITFFNYIGIEVNNGYGITECTPLISVNRNKKGDHFSVGKHFRTCEVMIIDQDEDGIGEICVKGENVMMGYYKDEESNAKSFEGEWFKTGDYGSIDQDNNICISGRKKNLIVLSNGKNVHPEELESYIYSAMPYVKEALAYIDKNKKGSEVISCYVYLDQDIVTKSGIDDVELRLQEDLKELNKKLPNYKKIQHIYIKEEEFEKNSSKKIIRHKFLEEVSQIG